MSDYRDINSLNTTPTALITGGDKVPFYNTGDAYAYAMTLDQLQSWVLSGGTIDPTFDDVSADTVTITGTTGNTLVVDTNTLVVDAANNRVGVGTVTPSTSFEVVGKPRFNTQGAGTNFISIYTSATDESLIRAAAASSSYNGLYLVNNATGVTTQATTGLPSWYVDIGGTAADGANFPTSSQDSFRIGRVAGGGSFLNTPAVLQITSSGNVGIGTTNPLGKLQVTGSTASFIMNTTGTEFYNNNAGVIKLYASNAAGFLSFGSAGRDNDLILNTSGNLGLGVTPSAWSASFKALQVSTASLWSSGGSNALIGANYYHDGTNRRYISTAAATEYGQSGGSHIWYTAPSGTAGNAITFTQAMTLDASGNLGIGTTSIPSGRRLAIAGGSVRVDSDQQVEWGGSTVGIYGNASTNTLTFFTNTTTRLQLKSTGQTRFTPLAADPSGAEAGDVYYNSGTNKLKVYNGTSWVDLH